VIRLAWWFRFVDLKSGDGFGGGPGDLGDDQAVLVLHPPGGVRGFHRQCPSGVDDADVHTLLATTSAPRQETRRGTRSGSAGNTGAGHGRRWQLGADWEQRVAANGAERRSTALNRAERAPASVQAIAESHVSGLRTVR
jgi:hypothetical protein